VNNKIIKHIISGPELQKGESQISFLKEYFIFPDQCVTYCCLIVSGATLGQYLDISAPEIAWNSTPPPQKKRVL
jgi:hypothetical protein